MAKITMLRNTMRLIAASSTVLMMAGAGAAFAQYSSSSNNALTGPNSFNDNHGYVNDHINYDVNARNNVGNRALVDMNTGFNTIGHNTVAGMGFTGSANADFIVNNALGNGTGTGALFIEPLVVTNTSFNDTTGPFSSNTNTTQVNRSVSVHQNTQNNISTSANFHANTGYNTIGGNTEAGGLGTGPVNIVGSVTNIVDNAGDVVAAPIGATSVVTGGSNHLTGPNSFNSNDTIVTSDTHVDVNTTNNIDNSFSVDANTGNNHADGNTVLDGGLQTGSISAHYDVTNQVMQ